MKIYFEKIKLHHFLSFGDAEIELNDRGYTLVSGVNLNKDDASKSNGSGKSSIWSAISYALTGETIQGLSSNLPNIYFNDGCWVELTFKIDKDTFVLTRSRDFKKSGSDLKILINGEDKSGKGIRESEALLKQYLPDLTSNLLGSVIILGQGLPHKFTNNSPSGRKEVLEKLSKSDFMIEDIKNRINARSSSLSKVNREIEDDLLKTSSTLSLKESQLLKQKQQLEELQGSSNFDDNINSSQKELDRLLDESNDLNLLISRDTEESTPLEQELSALREERVSKLEELAQELSESIAQPTKDVFSIEGEISWMKQELNKLSKVSDICPTCGQKLQGVVLPNTSQLEQDIVSKSIELEELKEVINNIKKDNEAKRLKLTENLANSESLLKERLNIYAERKNSNMDEFKALNAKITTLSSYIATLTAQRDSYNDNIRRYSNEIKTLEEEITNLNADMENLKFYKEDISKHIEVVNKMSTYVKRDFRGFLLTNVISFIQTKAKEYCKLVFDTDNIKFELEGNNIVIEYNGRVFENLSGGEKQKVDLILQFSIRDMLCQYLDFSSNILVLDEIFDNLDSIGCSKVLNLIAQKLVDIESIFIISHHSDELSIPSDEEIVVIKDERGVSCIQ